MWQVADTFLRVFTDSTFEEVRSDLPSWVITGETVPSTTEFYPLVEDYQAQYMALWGVA